MLEADSPPASGPSNAASASSKSPLEMPLRYRIGIRTSRLFERRAYGGRIADVNRMRLSPAPMRSRTRGARTATGPRPVMIARSVRWPWRTSRWRPSSVCLSAWPLRKAATSASTACANRARAPSRRTSVSGSEKASGWISLTTLLSWVTACHSFGGEVEVSNTPTIRRLIPHAVTNFRAYLLAEHLWPVLDEPLANRYFETLTDLEQTVTERCRVLNSDPLKPGTNFHWWPKSIVSV